ncbi:hypothetical protein LTR94_033355, partial [Friedmanniomyces endolithicus]
MVRSAKTPGLHADGNGLYLQVYATGGKSWIYRYQIAKRSRDMGLGSLLDVSLAEARDLRDAARKLAKAGRDPIEARRTAIEPPTIDDPSVVPVGATAVRRLGAAPTLRAIWVDYVAGQET